MILLSERAEYMKRNNELRFWHHAGVPGPVYWRKTRSMASTAECVPEFLCKLGGGGHEAEVSTRHIDEMEPQLPREHLIRLVRHLVSGVASSNEYELPGMRSEGVEIKLNSRILAQLMLHPVRSVRHRGLVRVLCHSMLYHLLIYASHNPTRKLVHGFGKPILAVGVVDPVEKGQPCRRIGQQ